MASTLELIVLARSFIFAARLLHRDGARVALLKRDTVFDRYASPSYGDLVGVVSLG